MLARLKSIPYLPVLVGMTVLRLVTAARTGLVPDEAYYWLWAQHPAFGYYDHPPMVAWWIMAMPLHQALFVRLSFVLSFLGLSWLIYDAGKALFDQAVARRAVLWLNACLLLSVGSVIATPDPPSVLMWAGGLWALARLHASQKGWWWLVFGVFAGLGVEAKYTNFFLGLGVIAWMIADKPARQWLRTPWPYLGAIVAALFMAPNLMWNAQHGWVTVAKQFGRIEAGQFTAKYLVEFMLTQPLLLNPLVYVFVCLGMTAALRTQDSRLRLLAVLPLPLFAYLLVHVFHDRIQGIWPAPDFPGLFLLAAATAEGVGGKWLVCIRGWATPVGVAVSALVLLILAFAPSLPGAAGLSGGWRDLSLTIDGKAMGAQARWIATTDYDTQAELSYNQVALGKIYIPTSAVVERERYDWPTDGQEGKALIVVAPNHDFDLAPCFDQVRDLGIVSRGKPGKKTNFHIYSGQPRVANCEPERRAISLQRIQLP